MPATIKRPQDKYKNWLIKKIEYLFSLRDMNTEVQRTIAHLSLTAYRDRRIDPGKFRLEELIKLSKKLDMPVWELLKPDENYK